MNKSIGVTRLAAQTTAAVTQVLSEQGLALTESGEESTVASSEDVFIAKIRLAAEGAHVGLTLLTSKRVLASIWPPGLDVSCDELVADYLAELANMSAGRLKWLLLDRGLRLDLGTPTCGSLGNRMLPPLGSTELPLLFNSESGVILVHLTAQLPEDCALNNATEPDLPAARPPAEMLLF